MIERILQRFSWLVEKYYVEIFVLEALLILLIYPSLRLAEKIMIAAIITTISSEGIKILIREKRPKSAPERRLHRGIFRINLGSFPSTHSAVAFMFSALLVGSTLFFPFFVFAAIIAYTRVYIKSHYIHDVIAGGLLGFVVGYAVLSLII